MSEEILINVTPRETRVAHVENGMLQEVFIERAKRRGLVGNVYKGKIQRVMPGMQAAFVDIGLERTAFLHASDILRGSLEAELGDSAQISAPVPVASAIGTNPSDATSAVMRTGRRRVSAPSRIASSTDRPCSLS